MQHPPVITIGRFRGEEEILAPPHVLRQQGIGIVYTSRGGSVTYHGPGQLIGYPIIHLKENNLGVREYLWKLEEVIIKLLLVLGIHGRRVARYPGGVWVNGKKICSIGIHVSHYITMHGFALNVNTDLRYFECIHPCGIKKPVMISMSELLGYSVDIETIAESWLRLFSEEFGLRRETSKTLSIEERIGV